MSEMIVENQAGKYSVELPKRSDLHISRKLWHILTGTTGLLIYAFNDAPISLWVLVTLGIGVIGLTFDFFRLRYAGINKFAVKVAGMFYRKGELTSYSGLPFYALGVGAALALFEERIAVLAILFLVLSDPISSFFGILYGKDKILPNKSIQGSLAGFFVCYIVTLFYGFALAEPNSDLIYFAFLAGITGALSELLSVFADDNLTIPVVSGVGLTLLNNFFHIF